MPCSVEVPIQVLLDMKEEIGELSGKMAKLDDVEDAISELRENQKKTQEVLIPDIKKSIDETQEMVKGLMEKKEGFLDSAAKEGARSAVVWLIRIAVIGMILGGFAIGYTMFTGGAT